jgi:hypothetical protein
VVPASKRVVEEALVVRHFHALEDTLMKYCRTGLSSEAEIAEVGRFAALDFGDPDFQHVLAARPQR